MSVSLSLSFEGKSVWRIGFLPLAIYSQLLNQCEFEFGY
jgi:hypothetical protein